jgi:hypothetical protein
VEVLPNVLPNDMFVVIYYRLALTLLVNGEVDLWYDEAVVYPGLIPMVL